MTDLKELWATVCECVRVCVCFDAVLVESQGWGHKKINAGRTMAARYAVISRKTGEKKFETYRF